MERRYCSKAGRRTRDDYRDDSDLVVTRTRRPNRNV